MLKFIGSIWNGSPKMGSRTSWGISNCQKIYLYSSVVTADQSNVCEKIESQSEKTDSVRSKSEYQKVNSVFDQINDGENSNLKHDELDINASQNSMENKYFKIQYAHMESVKEDYHDKTKPPKKREISVYQKLQNTNISDSANRAIELLNSLAVKRQRDKPTLQDIAKNINRSRDTFNIKKIADIFYGMASLTFFDDMLMKRLSSDILKSLINVKRSPIVGSIITSFGMLRYRDEAVLNSISEWMVKHKDIVRIQDLYALVMTLATVGYNPNNANILFKDLVIPLKETDMIKSSQWLDLIWALTILNQATTEQIDSVLNPNYAKKYETFADNIPSMQKIKMQNINAAAQLLMPNYSGSLLSSESKIFNIPIMKPRDTQIFIKSIADALANLFPSREHSRFNVNIGTGFLLDGEFCMDEKNSILILDKVKDKDMKNYKRIAIVANYYHDYCLGSNEKLLGPILLHYKLLKAMNYRILDISYKKFHAHDKLLTRITYLNDRIKLVVK